MNRSAFDAVLSGPSGRGYALDADQTQAVSHGSGPLWLLAGPGSGKTEALVTRTLKLVCVDRVAPAEIFLATFTRKAARSLEDRMSAYFAALQTADASLANIDLGEMRIGTLHQLCNDILQEYRYRPYQNLRLMDDFEQHIFVYRRATITSHTDNSFWSFFDYAVPPGTRWRSGGAHPPNKWARAKAAVVLFNRLVEDLVDLQLLRTADPHWSTLVDFFEVYLAALVREDRADFAHLQRHFADFLDATHGKQFVLGGANGPGLTHVLVDEYQDTNPIQELIYLRLAARPPHNLVVVGDDDQALYRFRGGTVACMVNFGTACHAAFSTKATPIPLTRNYRSHPGIVAFFDSYISSFTEMQAPGVRVSGKGRLIPSSNITGYYPSVVWMATKKAGDLGSSVARFVRHHLIGNGVISDPSQCLLLMRSAKNSPRNAGPFITAFEQENIDVYNPRSKGFMDAVDVRCLLATFVNILDPAHTFTGLLDAELVAEIRSWVVSLDQQLLSMGPGAGPLNTYISKSVAELAARCAHTPAQFLDLSVLEIAYRILALEPFRTWRADPSRNFRLSKLTRLLEAYHSNRQDLLRSSASGAGLDAGFVQSFYYAFVGYLTSTGIDEDEDDEVIVPRGYLPIMTIHQSKGLEFPVVIVGQLGGASSPGAAQELEVRLEPYRRRLYPRALRSPQQLAVEDDIRLLYVAYSRAQVGLVLAGTVDHFRSHVAAPGRDWESFRRQYTMVTV